MSAKQGGGHPNVAKRPPGTGVGGVGEVVLRGRLKWCRQRRSPPSVLEPTDHWNSQIAKALHG